MKRIGVIGLGLMGGSACKAYKEFSDFEIYAWNRSEGPLLLAESVNAIDGRLTDEIIPTCDMIIIALYPKASVEFLKSKAPLISKDAVVVDFCGVKQVVCDGAFPIAEEYGFTFIGGHPMAGTQYSGFTASRASLYKNASMILVPPRFDDILMLEKARELLAPLGFGRFVVTTAKKHDSMIAFTSQMAHVVSNAYIKSPTALEHKGYSAGSYKDLTRVAWLNEDMWTELFLDNREELVKEIDILISSLTEYRDALEDKDAPRLHDLLKEGRLRKEMVDGRR
jgi:prephenate dehydrogenase